MGSGLKTKKLTKLKMRVLTPMARASVTTTMAANAFCLPSCRTANRRS